MSLAFIIQSLTSPRAEEDFSRFVSRFTSRFPTRMFAHLYSGAMTFPGMQQPWIKSEDPSSSSSSSWYGMPTALLSPPYSEASDGIYSPTSDADVTDRNFSFTDNVPTTFTENVPRISELAKTPATKTTTTRKRKEKISSGRNRCQKKVDKRDKTLRNERERRRVQRLSDGFSLLRDLIPGKKKMSKLDTLRVAMDYMEELKELVASFDDDEKDLPDVKPVSEISLFLFSVDIFRFRFSMIFLFSSFSLILPSRQKSRLPRKYTFYKSQ